MHLERIAQTAYDLFPRYRTQKRREIVRDIGFCLKYGFCCRPKCSDTWKRLPTVNMTADSAEALLVKSSKFEEQITPEFFKAEIGKNSIEEHFKAQMGKFASVDLEQIFSDPWKERLRKMIFVYSPMLSIGEF